MFSDTAGEKAAKVCSKSSLSSRLDAHHTNTKDSYLVIKKYYKIILLPKITEHSFFVKEYYNTSPSCCQRILNIHIVVKGN